MTETLEAVAEAVRNLKDDVKDLERDHVTREEFLEVKAIAKADQMTIRWVMGAVAGAGTILGMMIPSILQAINEVIK